MEVNMRRGRIFIYLALILLLGLVAVAVVWMRLQPAAQASPVAEITPTPHVELVNVIVATQRIQRGSVIDEQVLGTIPIQRELMIEGYFTDLKQIVGHQARVDLEANMLLTKSMIVDSPEQLSTQGSIAALSIPRGMVAVSVPITRLSSVSYAAQAGDHVNVIATLLLVDLDTEYQTILPNNTAAVLGAGPGVVLGSEENSATLYPDLVKITAQNSTGGTASAFGRAEIDPLLAQTFYTVPSERQRPRLLSQTLLQDVVVLGVGNFPLQDEGAPVPTPTPAPPVDPATGAEIAPSAAQPTPEPQVVEALPDVITLIVNPQDAVTLNYLVYAGAQLTLALRSSNDDSVVTTEAISLDYLMRNYNIPIPLSLPYGMEPRVDELVAPELPNDGPQLTPIP
jgi:Flp pilus assembly protein CpaB